MGAKISTNPKWSFSSLKAFHDCPKKYYHLRVVRDFSEDHDAPHLKYGKEFHAAAEEYVRDGKPLEPRFQFAKDTLDKVIALRGIKLCEYKMGLTANLEKCGFHADDVWFRGVADLLIIHNDTAKILDYKTGAYRAEYVDKGQLEIMTLAVLKHFPEVRKIRAGLLFVKDNKFVTADYTMEDIPGLWSKWLNKYGRLVIATDTGVWNPLPSGLCKKHCVVLSCPHNGRK